MVTLFFMRLWRNHSLSGATPAGPALRKRDQICEILAPRIFHTVRQHDYAFRRKRFNRTFIMSHKNYRAAEASQRAENLFSASRIQVVRGLIEQQDVGPRYN